MFEDMSIWNDPAASSNASQLLSAVTDQRFLIAVCICARFSSLLHPLAKSLLEPTIDLIERTSQVTDVIAVLNRHREEVDDDFNEIFIEATELADEAIPIHRRAEKTIESLKLHNK